MQVEQSWEPEALALQSTEHHEHKFNRIQAYIPRIERFTETEYADFLKNILPVFLSILHNIHPQLDPEHQDQKLRKVILEVLQRIPYTIPLRQYALVLNKEVLNIIVTDNEVNGSRCLNILNNLHKAFKEDLESTVGPFLEFFKSLCGHFRNNAFNALSTYSVRSLCFDSFFLTPFYSPLMMKTSC